MKKSFKIGRKKGKQSQDGSGEVSSSAPKAKRSLFHGSSSDKRQKALEGEGRRSNSPLQAMDAHEGGAVDTMEERPTRRQGSLLELHGKLGVLLA